MARELLFRLTRDDFEWEYFRAGGKGGQNQNKVSSACRCRHPPSGVVVECREERDQITNRRRAFQRLAEHPRFRAWLRVKVAEHDLGKSIEQQVDESMAPRFLVWEGHDGQRWVPLTLEAEG